MSSGGKGARNRRKVTRAAKKRERKAANTARYQTYIAQGRNAKSARAKALRVKNPGHDHKQGPCGNIGCLKCSEEAKVGAIKMRMATHGARAAEKLVESRGWV